MIIHDISRVQYLYVISGICRMPRQSLKFAVTLRLYRERLQHDQARAKKWLNAVQEVASLRPPTLDIWRPWITWSSDKTWWILETWNTHQQTENDENGTERHRCPCNLRPDFAFRFSPSGGPRCWCENNSVAVKLLRSAEICWDGGLNVEQWPRSLPDTNLK